MKSLYYLMFLIFPSLYGYSQIPLTDIVKKKIEPVDSVNEFRKYIGEKILLPPFKNIDLRKNSQFYTIRFYKPSVISENSRPTISSIYYPYNYKFGEHGDSSHLDDYCSNWDSISNTYFTIINSFNGISFGWPRDFNSRENFTAPQDILLLKNEKNGDSIYINTYEVLKKFISVSYFEKLKQLYDNKILIYIYGNDEVKHDIQDPEKEISLKPGSKWKCNIVVSKIGSYYRLFYTLENEKNEKIAIEESGFENFETQCLVDNTDCIFDEKRPFNGFKDCAQSNGSNHTLIQFLTESEFLKRKSIIESKKKHTK